MTFEAPDWTSVAAFGVAALCAGGAIRLVLASPTLRRRLARVTRRAPQDDERALVRVGGLALAAAVGVLVACGFAPSFGLEAWLGERAGFDVELAPGAALCAALVVGALDDLLARGLGAAAKFALQFAVGAVLVAPLVSGDHGLDGLALAATLMLAAVVAQNALNTFDNADGTAGGLALLALGTSAFPASGALVGFLAHNLPWRGRTRVMLGDAGSHVLGIAFLLTPAAWPALALPLLDLARVVLVRRAEGRPIWRGDRAHLAHRLQGLGLSSFAVAGWLLAVALPSVWLGAWGDASGTAWPALSGVLGSTALFLLLVVRVTRLERRRLAPAISSR